MNTVRIHASKGHHEFYFDAPSMAHESLQALEGIGYALRVVARLLPRVRTIAAFGGQERVELMSWVDVA